MTLDDLKKLPCYRYVTEDSSQLDTPAPESPISFGNNPPSSFPDLSTEQDILRAQKEMNDALLEYCKRSAGNPADFPPEVLEEMFAQL